MIAVVYITFFSLVVILLLVSLYLINSLIVKQYRKKKMKKEFNKIEQNFYKHMKKGGVTLIPLMEIKFLRKKVNTCEGLQIFTEVFQKYVKENSYTEQLKSYVGNIIEFETIYKNKVVKGKYRDSYILYLTAIYKITTEESKDYAFKMLDDDALYTRNNALRVLQNFEDTQEIIKALEIISKSDKYFNEKIIVEFLEGFCGDRAKLSLDIVNNIEDFKDEVISAIIQYFTKMREEQNEVQEKILYLLALANSEEIVIEATKYFGYIKNNDAIEMIMNNLEHPNWEVRATSAEMLRTYDTVQNIKRLKEKLFDSNWFVKMNSAFSLVNMNINLVKFNDIINSEDKSALQVYNYALYKKGKISIQEFNQMQEYKEVI